ncbi:DUF4386 family protein [Ruminiclostridium josui]|uniref:DUF4386 family protein n=1 Tax=Ruminiclostridium josui TaxID=1499 RepID=UPI0006D1F60E|nr:DUF4386 family protein [Ruminiclostridium josui]
MIPTNQKTFFRVSGILAIIAAVFYIVIGICIGFDPSEQKSGVEYYLELFKNPSLGYLWRILFSLTGLMNIMIFIAYGNYISKSQDSDYLFVKVLTAIGLISAILHTIDWVRDISFINNCLKFYNENQLENLKAMINMNEVLKYTDENFIWRFGFFGFYVIGVSVVALRKGLLSRGINIIGILSGTFSYIYNDFFNYRNRS